MHPSHSRCLARVCASLALTLTIGAAVPGSSSAAADARIATYAQRQAIRDRYRGQIDELTFNDELSDGVSLDQALSDALAARTTLPKRSLP